MPSKSANYLRYATASDHEQFELQSQLRQWRLLGWERLELLNRVYHEQRTQTLKGRNRGKT